MEDKFYDIAFKIDELIKEYSFVNLEKIESYLQHKGIYEHFFKELSKTINPFPWLKPLKEKGYFKPENNPEPQEVPDQPGYYRTPHWSVLDYLEKVANENMEEPSNEITDTLIEIVNAVIDYKDDKEERIDNFSTDWMILKIISTFPVEKIKIQHVEFIRDALKSKWNTTLVAGGIGKTILPKLVKSKAKELVIKLLDIMLDYQKEENEFHEKYKSIMDDYWLNKALNKYKTEISELCGIEAAEIALEKIKEIIQLDDSHFNYIWIPTIEDHSQNSLADKYECILLRFVRDIFELSEPDKVREKIEILLKEEHSILKRLAVHTIKHHYKDLNDLFWKWNGNPLNEKGLKHELYELLKNNCASFNGEQMEQVLEWIESKDYYISEEIKDDEEKKNDILAYRKREWLSALLESNNKKVIEKNKEYEKINLTKIEHPGFDSWTESMRGNVSPIEQADLIAKSNEEIVNFINQFKEEKGWKKQSRDGLADTLRSCVLTKPDKFSSDLMPFLKISRMYQNSILNSLGEAWRTNKNFKWDGIFEFVLEIIGKDEFWKEEYQKEQDNYRDWIVSNIAELIEEGTRNDKHAFGPKHLPKAEEILLILAQKTKSELSKINDLISSVLNSTKGKVFSAMVNYSLRYARLHKKNEEKRWVESIQRDFEKRFGREFESSPEFLVILGQYLPNLDYLDKKWVADNINKIFPKNNDVQWEAVFTGHIFYSNRVYKELYDLLKNNGHYVKALETDFKDEHAKERLTQHICVGYIEDWEKIEDKNSLISKLIESKDASTLSEIVSFFRMQRDSNNEKIKTKIKPLWKVLFEISTQYIEKPEYQQVVSGLTNWLSLIDEIDDEILKWLKLSTKYLKVEHNAPSFIEYLLKHASKSPEKVSELYLEMLNNEIYPYYEEETIKGIVKKLYEKNQIEAADKICNMYGEKGYDFLWKSYKYKDKYEE